MHSTCVKHLQKDGYSEVTGIVHILERGLFLSVGWDKKITTFRDEPDVSKLLNLLIVSVRGNSGLQSRPKLD